MRVSRRYVDGVGKPVVKRRYGEVLCRHTASGVSTLQQFRGLACGA